MTLVKNTIASFLILSVITGCSASRHAIIAVGVVAAAGAGGSNNYSSGYAWDQFYDGNYNLVWRCRDKSTGQFAYNSACSGQYQNDNTWTGK